MKKNSKRTKALKFDVATRLIIWQRERGKCFFCERDYEMPYDPDIYKFDMGIKDIMHFVNKSSGGLGIEENGVLGCRYHHHLLDNGNRGKRGEMLEMLEEYLKSIYPNWSKEDLYYKKG